MQGCPVLPSPRPWDRCKVSLLLLVTQGMPGEGETQDETLGRAETPLSPTVYPASTQPHLRITEMILAKSKRRAWGFVCC